MIRTARTFFQSSSQHPIKRLILALFPLLVLAACSNRTPSSERPPVLATISFLADIAQNVAGERFKVEALIPSGLDPHSFEPTPSDVIRIAESQVLIANGAGLEEWLQEVIQNAGDPPGGVRLVIEAASGLPYRTPQAGELAGHAGEHQEGDPHLWLDPNLVITYVENIRAGLTRFDPQGADVYAQNAAAYTDRLQELDRWIQQQVQEIPPQRRVMVTNHESFGYFADHYGFQIIGAIIPSVSSGSTPSAQQFADLVERIRSAGAPAVFLETGANPQLAEQLAQETGVRVVSPLYTHALTPPDGDAPTYLDMMRYNTTTIVEALK